MRAAGEPSQFTGTNDSRLQHRARTSEGMTRLLPVSVAAAVALTLAASASPASAYWEYGHQTVARIAAANVTPRTRIAIDRLLRQSALLGTPSCPARTI